MKDRRRPAFSLKVQRLDPILALAGAVVLIDTVSPMTITKVLRRNRIEAYVAMVWLVVHVSRSG